ncbi:MAG TPA: hypothetical protein VLT62_30735 [Candidatus Methylomirabilis sp.]|nr:hypothetical protein [Candidatus Methylomirabilis sp.]
MLLALAIMGYLVVSYIQQGSEVQETLQAIPGSPTTRGPLDPTKRGLEQRLAPILDQERQRVQDTEKSAGQ